MTPDFSKYSIRELQDAINDIDREAYPERKEQAEKMLQIKLQDNDAVAEEERSNREYVTYLCVFISVLTLALLYNPVFEQSVYVRGTGIVYYSEAPLVFWFYTIFYFAIFIGMTSWTVGLIKRT